MAAVIGETAPAVQLGTPGTPGGRGIRRGNRTFRYTVLAVAAVYFLVPIYTAAHFALQANGHFSVSAFTGLTHQQGFSSAFGLSLRLMVITTVITLVLMVPTTVYVHLFLPRLRPLFDGLTLLPLVIPPVVLIVGVLQVAPTFLKATPNLLALEYVVLAMPFVYRSLDAGLRGVDVRTLFDASRSLGAGWVQTLVRVVAPNIRSALLSATVLTVALVLGEYTMASLDQYQTFPVWIVYFDQDNSHVSVAASLAALVVTWLLLVAISLLDRRRRAS